jgi:hypothetical protein
MMTRLYRAVLVAAITGVSIPMVAAGQNVSADSLLRRVDSLQRRTVDLERRVVELEALVRSQPPRTPPIPALPTSQDVANWRRLHRGMTEDEVRAILGEPEKVEVMSLRTIWTWGDGPEGASLYFDNDKLAGWSEPGH